jgi:hypothetical protein
MFAPRFIERFIDGGDAPTPNSLALLDAADWAKRAWAQHKARQWGEDSFEAAFVGDFGDSTSALVSPLKRCVDTGLAPLFFSAGVCPFHSDVVPGNAASSWSVAILCDLLATTNALVARATALNAIVGSSDNGRVRNPTSGLEHLERRLRSFRDLPRDWNGAETAPVPEHTVDRALRLVRNLPPGLRAPQATASADGEIVLTWFKGTDRFNAALDPDNTITWFTRIDGQVAGGGESEITADGAIPDLYEALSKFYK